MIASRALQLKAVTGGDAEATRELIRSKLQMSGLAIPDDMEDGFVAGLQDKMASQKVGMGAASRSKFVAEMLAKLKSKYLQLRLLHFKITTKSLLLFMYIYCHRTHTLKYIKNISK